ncbi:MAG: hypothetical protein FWG87_11440 [Defluviitaleaceae bacterium]|nr:hypothetical protein [Defluviitaleaceae bacterium]
MAMSKISSEFLTSRAWYRDVVGGKDLVLCHTSALECLELFSGYVNEKNIYVYAKEKGEYENLNYHIVNNFDNLDIVNIGNLLCTSFNQTVNDMLADFINTDEQALAEALSNYFHANKRSFTGLTIYPQNMKNFNYMKEWAVDYYNERVVNSDIARTAYVPNIRQTF